MQASEIKEIRKRLNLNQTEFGELIGVSLRSVQMYEKGNTKPSADVLIKLLELNELRDLYGHSSKLMTIRYAKVVKEVYRSQIVNKSPDF